MATIIQKKRVAVKKPAPRSAAVKTALKAPARPLATIHLSETMTQMLTALAKKQHKSVAYVAEHLIEEALEAQDDEDYVLTEEEYFHPGMIKRLKEAEEQIRRDSPKPCSLDEFWAQVAEEAHRVAKKY